MLYIPWLSSFFCADGTPPPVENVNLSPGLQNIVMKDPSTKSYITSTIRVKNICKKTLAELNKRNSNSCGNVKERTAELVIVKRHLAITVGLLKSWEKLGTVSRIDRKDLKLIPTQYWELEKKLMKDKK